ncbi:hypothetical protein NBO_24g0002, partial [Nosema bombycis CQ1]
MDFNKISKLYLQSLSSELVIYDELDLVLISYGCGVSIKLEGDGELFSSALPDEYSHRVYIRIGKGQPSSDTVSPALKYKPGPLKKVEKYLSTRNIPKAVSFPNKISELISDNANENLRNMEYFEDYTGEIRTVFDIDGISLFIKQVGTLVDRRVGREIKLFEKVINRDEIGVFVARLKELYPELSLFVESYDSKAGLASHRSSLVLKG